MKDVFKKIWKAIDRFFSKKKNRRLVYIIIIFFLALGNFLYSGLARRTFVFYSHIGDNIVVEDRMLHWSSDREANVRRYVEEALLGPKSPGAILLFHREASLITLMLREGVVYVNLSETAVLPFQGSRDLFRSVLTLNEGIKRNFSYVNDVRIFIGGNEAFYEDFRRIF
ncbi:MAG: hypothetical protein FWG77_00425 [Treponema sp.]|nr:hypothetical protein [Treponema sp.]